MHPVRKRKLILIISIALILSLAIGIILYNLSENINLFKTPTQVVNKEAAVGQKIRVGGIVVAGSVNKNPQTLDVDFQLTDGVSTITLKYNGILPDLFKEGQGVVADGIINSNNELVADVILAKHDENYVPPEVVKALEEAEIIKAKQIKKTSYD